MVGARAVADAGSRRAPGQGKGPGIISREHGANLMSIHALLLGAVAGFAAGGGRPAGLLLSLAFGALFLPMAAAVSSLSRAAIAGRARRRLAELSVAFVLLSAVALAWGPVAELLAIGAAAAGIAVLYGLARTKTGARSVIAQLVAIAGISLFAPLAWLLVGGPSVGWGWSAPAAFLAFGGTVPYVRERVRRRKLSSLSATDRLRRGVPALAWQAAALSGASAATAFASMSWLVPLAFVPGAVKTVLGLARPETRPPIGRIGIVETVLSTVFAVLAGIGLAT